MKENAKVTSKKHVKTFLVNFFIRGGSERLQIKNTISLSIEKPDNCPRLNRDILG